MNRSPRRRRAKQLQHRLAHDEDTSRRYETFRRLNRSGKPALARFVSIPVTGFLLISGASVHVHFTPETFSATLAALGMAGGTHWLRYRHRS